MFSFVVSVSFFWVLSQDIGWEERLWNDLFCVGWDIKPQSVNSIRLFLVHASESPCKDAVSFLQESMDQEWMNSNEAEIILLAKVWEYVLTGIGLCVCLRPW